MVDRDVFCGECGARVPVPAAPVHVTLPSAGPPAPPAEEADDGKGRLVLVGGVVAVIAGAVVVVVCLCLVVGTVGLGLLLPTMETTPTQVVRTVVVRKTVVRPTARVVEATKAPTRTPRPSPTRTPRPSSTATRRASPTSTTSTTSTTYTDNFSQDRGNWSLTTSSNGERWLEDGELHIKVLTANYVIWSRLKDYRYDNLTMEVDARVVSGSGGNYGLLFRVENSNNYYRFVVSTTGRYRVMKLVNRSWKTIKGWTTSSAVKTGSTENHLKVVAQGSSITVYANGQELTTVTDSDFTHGEVALIAAAGTTADFEVAFDNFEVKSAGLLD
jgi:hypothetical protein